MADRKKIAAYIAHDNPVAAVELVDLLMSKDTNQKIGHVGRMKGTREWGRTITM